MKLACRVRFGGIKQCPKSSGSLYCLGGLSKPPALYHMTARCHLDWFCYLMIWCQKYVCNLYFLFWRKKTCRLLQEFSHWCGRSRDDTMSTFLLLRFKWYPKVQFQQTSPRRTKVFIRLTYMSEGYWQECEWPHSSPFGKSTPGGDEGSPMTE